MRSAWYHYRTHPTHFWSCDVKTMIFRKKCYSSFIFTLKTSSKNKVILDVICSDLIHEIDTGRKKIGEKRILKN